MATGNPRHRGKAPKEGHDPRAEALKQYVVDTVTEKVAAKVQAKTDQLEEKLNRKLAASSPDLLDVWTRMEPGSRRPRFTREEIAVAAVRIADAEGIDALSMRRLAAELGAGTMTLYHYVHTKDELLALVTDEVMREIILPPAAVETHWRAAITAIANSSRAALERHPWVYDIADDPAAGPNGVRHFDQSMQAVSSMPGALRDRLDVIYAVDEYVFGYCLSLRDRIAGGADGDRAMMTYVGGLVASGGYPHIASLIDEHGLEDLWTIVEEHGRDDTRFDRNLARLLDGIEASLQT